MQFIQNALDQKTTDFDSLREKANILAALKRFPQAVDAYKAALRQKSDDTDVKILLGFAYLAVDKPKDALDAFEAVMKEHKNIARVWLGRGQAFLALGEEARGLVNCGTAAMIEQDFPRALECFDNAIQANPKFPEAWSNKGVLLEKMGQFQDAAAAYRHALSLDPAAVICMHNLGLILIHHLDCRDEGLSWLKNTLKYDPQRWFKLPSELRSAVDAAKYPDM